MPPPWQYTRDTYVEVFGEGASVFGQITGTSETHYTVRIGGTKDQEIRVPIQLTGPHSMVARVGKSTWGETQMVAPGLIVELQSNENDSFVDFIRGLVATIRRIPIGAALLWEFDPRNRANNFRQIDDGEEVHARSGGMYRGATVVVRQPERGDMPIQTVSFGGRKKLGGGKVFSPPTVPLIKFYNRPARGTTIELRSEQGPIRLAHDGVVTHPDFPDTRSDYATVFFHELCHAWYDQTGIAAIRGTQTQPIQGAWTSAPVPKVVIDPSDNTEEQMVSGLLAGKGVTFCENRYRHQANHPLRRSYKAVGIGEDLGVHTYDWSSTDHVDPRVVLRNNGYTV